MQELLGRIEEAIGENRSLHLEFYRDGVRWILSVAPHPEEVS